MTSAMPPATNRPHPEPEPPVHPDHDRGPRVRRAHPRGAPVGARAARRGRPRRPGRRAPTGTSGRRRRAPPPRRAARRHLGEPERDRSGTASAARRAVDTEVPDETGGPYPGDGTNGPNVLDDTGHRPLGHRARRSAPRRRRRPASRSPSTSPSSTRPNGYGAMAGRRRLRVALRRAGPLLDVLAGRRGRELPARRAADRRRAARRPSPRSSRAATRAAGRTSTSRSTAAPPRRRAPGRSSGPARSRCPQAACEEVYADTATYPASADEPRGHVADRDNVFGDDGGIHQLATVTGDASSGYVANLTIGV